MHIIWPLESYRFAYSVLFVLILLGTWLDDNHSRPPIIKSDVGAASHVTEGLAHRTAHNGWRGRYRHQDVSRSPGERTIPNELQQAKLAENNSQLAPQRNPLVSFSSAVSSPIGSDGPPSDNLSPSMAVHNNNKANFEDNQRTTQADGSKCKKSGEWWKPARR